MLKTALLALSILIPGGSLLLLACVLRRAYVWHVHGKRESERSWGMGEV